MSNSWNTIIRQEVYKAIQCVIKNPHSTIFREPVNDLPNYHQIITHPMDLHTLSKLVLESAPMDIYIFLFLSRLIFKNAFTYYAGDVAMEKQSRICMQIFKQYVLIGCLRKCGYVKLSLKFR